ncbi:MAG: hypothetical protein HUJ31_16910 [Pseudomonadales bacterium]|nr:hypothetical protein [Pseudomonadales bacterium]
MDSIDEFLYRNREQLLRYLDGKVPRRRKDAAALQFVDQVVGEWSRLFGGRELPPPTRKERTFWYTLYLFEEIQEMPRGHRTDPWFNLQKRNLDRLRELLRNNADLPPEFFATRPGEEDWGDDEDWDDWDDGVDDDDMVGESQA